jgi:hypothetical protein
MQPQMGIVGVVACLFCSICSGQGPISPKFYSVLVSAQVQSEPPQIQLSWPLDPLAASYRLSRKGLGIFATWNPTAAALPAVGLAILPGGFGQLHLEVSGPANTPFAVEDSDDMANWNVLITNYLSGSAFDFTVPVARSSARHFYRTRTNNQP